MLELLLVMKPSADQRRFVIHRKETSAAQLKEHQLIKAYGVNLNWYWDKLKEQGGHCALCPATDNAPNAYFDVDHDHETGLPRGLLCRRCNARIGTIELKEWFALALRYLLKYRLVHARWRKVDTCPTQPL